MRSPVGTVHTLFNKPSADLILRSCDSVDFYVLKAIMAEASPVFEDMLALPQPATGGLRSPGRIASDARVTQMTEDARTIEHVLRFIYPVEPPDIAELGEIFPVLEMCDKLMLACVTKLAVRQYAALAEKQPLRAYALACRWRREDAMRIAARASLAYPAPERTTYLAELEDVTAGAVVRLHQYHSKCSAAVATLRPPAPSQTGTWVAPWVQADDRPWVSSLLSSRYYGVYYSLTMAGGTTVRPSRWWIDCMLELFKKLKFTPDPNLMKSPGEIAQFLRAVPSLVPRLRSEEVALLTTALCECAEELARAIEGKISEVCWPA